MEIHNDEQIRREAGYVNTPALLEAARVAGILADIQLIDHSSTPALRETASVAEILGDIQKLHHTSTPALREAASVAGILYKVQVIHPTSTRQMLLPPPIPKANRITKEVRDNGTFSFAILNPLSNECFFFLLQGTTRPAFCNDNRR